MSDTFVCTHCGECWDIEDRHNFDGAELCPDCYDEETVVCEHCGRRIWADNAVDSDRILCERCYDDYYVNCEGCGRTLHNDNAYYFDDGNDYPYCHNCYEQRCSGEYIHDYSFKPEPIFYGDGNRYFGVELEIDEGGHDDGNAEKLTDIANTIDEKRIYIKHDGSLNDGMEIVTHPMSLDYHLNEMPWSDVMSKAIRMGYLSHKTNTCGLHIHVNRSTFGSNHDEQEERISRVLFFVERFWQELLKFSRIMRSNVSTTYCERYEDDYDYDDYDDDESNELTCISIACTLLSDDEDDDIFDIDSCNDCYDYNDVIYSNYNIFECIHKYNCPEVANLFKPTSVCFCEANFLRRLNKVVIEEMEGNKYRSEKKSVLLQESVFLS